MPWTNQTGGGGAGGGNGRGPGGQGPGNGGGPWGQPPRRPNRPNRPGPGGGQQPPDLEEIIRRGQDRLRQTFGGRGGGLGGQGGGIGGTGISKGLVAIVAAGLALLYVFNGFYTVQEDERGVVLTFGHPSEELAGPGLNFHFPIFQTVEIANISEQRINIGGGGRTEQGLMLSGDQNIVDVQFAVLYQVEQPTEYLFNIAAPDDMVQQVAESSMREIVGRRPAQDVFRDARVEIAQQVREQTQSILNEYGAGVSINQVAIEEAAPPGPVADAFDEVQRAEQDEDRFVEEANRDTNRILGGARGQAAQIREEAEAYANRVVQEAQGEAQRFLSVYEQYVRAPEVTRRRLFLETVEEVMRDAEKTILESGGGGEGVVPILSLNEATAGASAGTGGADATGRNAVAATRSGN